MSQDKKGSSPPQAGYQSPFDDKTVVRPKKAPAPAGPPPGKERAVASPPSSLDAKFEERTAVAPRKPTPVPSAKPLKAEEPEAENFPVRDHALNIERPPKAPKIPPKPIPAAFPNASASQEDSWDIRQEITHPGTFSGVVPEMTGKDDRRRNLFRGLAAFAAVMLMILIFRKFSKPSQDTQDLAQETAVITAPVRNDLPARAPSAKASAPGSPSGTMDELMQQIDQAFFSSQSQIR